MTKKREPQLCTEGEFWERMTIKSLPDKKPKKRPAHLRIPDPNPYDQEY